MFWVRPTLVLSCGWRLLSRLLAPVNAPGEVDDDVTLTLRSQRPMTLQDPGVEARDRAGVFEGLIDDAVDHGFLVELAKMLRNIVRRK